MSEKIHMACVLLNYNDCLTTIKAAERASQIPEIELIVIIDNCSPNGDYTELKQLEDNHTIVHVTDHNGGYGFGNNEGMKIAKEMGMTHVIIANPDVTFDRNSVKSIITAFGKIENSAVVAPCTYYKGKPCFSRLPTIKQIVLESSSLHNKIFGRNTEYVLDDNVSVYVECDEVVGAMLAIDIEALEPPIYDENIFLYCEEWVLAYKVKEKGLKTIVCMDSTYTHELSHSIDIEYRGMIKKRKLSNKSKLYYIKKYMKANPVQVILTKIGLSFSIIEAYVYETMHKR